jgi:hypothetical protein
MVINGNKIFLLTGGFNMLICSNPFYVNDNGNGYSLDVRDVICSECHIVIDRQKKYKGNKDFEFSDNYKKDFKYCPFCGSGLY